MVGEAGIGKTALLANWLRRWRAQHGATSSADTLLATGPYVLSHFATASAASAEVSPCRLCVPC